MAGNNKKRQSPPLQFAAFLAAGCIHGGGCIEVGEWRSSYEEAEKEVQSARFQTDYGDSINGVMVRHRPVGEGS